MKFWTSAACPAARQSKGFGELSGELTVRRIISEMVEPGPLGVPGPGTWFGESLKETKLGTMVLWKMYEKIFLRHTFRGHVFVQIAKFTSTKIHISVDLWTVTA